MRIVSRADRRALDVGVCVGKINQTATHVMRSAVRLAWLFTVLTSVLVGVMTGAASASERCGEAPRTMVNGAKGGAPESRKLPANVRMPDVLRRALEDALPHSPTLRRQMDVIAAAPRFRVNVVFGGMRGNAYDALSRFYRHEWGAILVEVTLYMPGNLIQLMAHELEHICEQIEGVDLRAAAGGAEAYVVGDRYETARAIAIGHQVWREVDRGRRGRDARAGRVDCGEAVERVGTQP